MVTMRKGLALAGFCAFGAAATTGAGTWGYYDTFRSGRALPGTFIEGQVAPDGVTLGDWLEARRQRLLDREAYLELPDGDTLKTSYGALGIELDVGKTMDRVQLDSAEGSLSARLYRAIKARRGQSDVAAVWSFDGERAKATLQRLAPDIWRDPVDARLDLVNHRRIDEVPGRELDVEGTLAKIAAGDRDPVGLYPVATKPVAPQVTSAMLATVDVSEVLSSFETKFGGTGGGRATNIGTAARYLNGLVIAPGQTVSFNQVVGPRTMTRGFVMAPVIKDDELEPGLGGGTCQVASTVHAAAVYGALDIVARRSHSRPSGYAPLGLDATVIYGEVDLRLKNPYDTPLILHAFLPTPDKLRVEFLGRVPPGKVEHSYAVTQTHDFYRRIWTKPFLGPGKVVKHQRGHKGYDVVSSVKVTYPDGHVAVRHYFSGYRPVPEVYWVGSDADLGELPELPSGADHVEVDGVAGGGDSAPAGDGALSDTAALSPPNQG
jgi:vancomycin resistance protein YoaR